MEWRAARLVGLRLRTEGQVDPEAGTLSDCGFDANTALHAGDPAPDQREADAGPGNFVSVKALEDAEDSFVMFGSDADAVVFDPDSKILAVGRAAKKDGRVTGGFAELYSVIKKVGKSAFQNGGIGVDGGKVS